MSLSVIVTSYQTPALLKRCVDALLQQPDADEIIIADCSSTSPAAALAPLPPKVRLLRFETKQTVPQLRWAAFWSTTGDLVAAIEARCAPAPNWCADLVATHRHNPNAPVVGGPVAMGAARRRFEWGLYFAEYGRFAPPIPSGNVPELSLANVCYKRQALEAERDLLDAGFWDTAIHARWRARGLPLVMCAATVVFENTMDVPTILRQRFQYGRGYAAQRMAGASVAARLGYAMVTPFLPALLTWRTYRESRGKPISRDFIRALDWTLRFNLAWAAGEFTGYVFGAQSERAIF